MFSFKPLAGTNVKDKHNMSLHEGTSLPLLIEFPQKLVTGGSIMFIGVFT